MSDRSSDTEEYIEALESLPDSPDQNDHLDHDAIDQAVAQPNHHHHQGAGEEAMEVEELQQHPLLEHNDLGVEEYYEDPMGFDDGDEDFDELEEEERARMAGLSRAIPPHFQGIFQQFMGGGHRGLMRNLMEHHGFYGMHDDGEAEAEADDGDQSDSPDQVTVAVHQFLEAFEAQYGEVHPPFYIGSFEEAKSTARETGKFLFLYLHSQGEEVDLFCHQVLCQEQIVHLLAENCIVWGWDVSSPERMRTLRKIISKHVSSNINFFLPTEFPFTCFLAVINGSLTLLDSTIGFVSVDDLFVKILTVVETHGRVLEEERAKLQQRERDRLERERLLNEQENEYIRSLEEDRVKELQRIEEQKRKEEEEQAALKRQQEAEAQLALLKQSLPAEPEPGNKEASTLLFRLPGGGKLQRRFLSSESLQTIFDFLKTEGCAIDEGHTVQTNFPKRVISELDPSLSLKSANLYPQETLFVQKA